MAWITPVYDRTLSDVDEAIRVLTELKNGGNGAVSELKGCFNATDMNRIEGNIRYLADTLTTLYYFTSVTTKSWGKEGLPTVTDINRLMQNVKNIRASYYQPTGMPTLPSNLTTFTEVNNLERSLSKYKSYLDNMINSFRECGTFECEEG